MKLLIYITLSLLSTQAIAADIFQCGNTFTDKPCGSKMNVFNDTPSCADQVSAVKRFYEDKLYVLSREYGQREFELTKAYIGAPRVTQNTTVTTIGGGASAIVTGSCSRSPAITRCA